MKRRLFLLLIIWTFFLSGCSIPVSKSSDDTAKKDTQPETTHNMSSTDNNTVDNGNKPEGEDTQQKGINKQSDSGKGIISLVLYYQDGQGYVIPATRKVEKQEGLAKTSLNGIVDNPVNREDMEFYGLYPVLPKDTQIKGISIKEGTAIVDFSNKLLEYKNKNDERNIVTAIVYTLTEFKTIKNVKILINGYEQKKLKYNTDISGLLSRDNVLINTSKVNPEQKQSKFDIYLFKHYDDKYSYILPVSLELPDITSENIPYRIVEAFSYDWTKQKLYSGIPKGVKLTKADKEGNKLILDFNGEMRNYGGSAREDEIIKQILYSAKQLKGVEKVEILVNGKEDNLPEGTETRDGLAVPSEINNFVDSQ